MKKKILIGAVIIYTLGSSILLTNGYKTIRQQEVVINDISTEKVELVNTINTIQEETEKLVLELTETQSELDSARQEHYELEAEIERIEEVERKFIASRGAVTGIEFATYSDITAIRIDNGDLLDMGLVGKLKGHGWDFVNAGIKYGIDPLFLAAISAQESGWGEFDHGNNNIFGIMSGAMYFSSYEECIEYTAELLSDYYVAEGLYTPALIQPKYCPSPDNWHYHIAAVANSILRNIME